jgi:DNA-binding response OmpR family regulator
LDEERLRCGDLLVEVGARRVSVGEAVIDLTGLEFDLLVALCRRQGRVVSRAALLELSGRGDVVVSDRTVDVHVSHLRRKLGQNEAGEPRIRTVRGVGYVLSEGGT